MCYDEPVTRNRPCQYFTGIPYSILGASPSSDVWPGPVLKGRRLPDEWTALDSAEKTAYAPPLHHDWLNLRSRRGLTTVSRTSSFLPLNSRSGRHSHQSRKGGAQTRFTGQDT